MTTFLFWNIGGRNLENRIANLAFLHTIDVVILAESRIPHGIMLRLLNRQGALYHLPFSECEKITIYTRFSRQFLRPLNEDTSRKTIRRLSLPGQTEILLAAVHLPDQRNWKSESRSTACVELSNEIKAVEQRRGHSRTVLVGDFNMNPFEAGMVNANGLHATMSRQIAQSRERVVQAQTYPFFYNPMWGLMGDATAGPPGTHYYRSSEHFCYFWNMLDQVLIRPDLLPMFRNDELQILTTDGEESFLSVNGLPNRSVTSDHMPLLFTLHL